MKHWIQFYLEPNKFEPRLKFKPRLKFFKFGLSSFNLQRLIIIIYNYFTGKLREFYFTKGSQDQFCLQNIQSAARDVLWTKLVEGTRGKVKFLFSRESSCTQFYRFWDENEREKKNKKHLIFFLLNYSETKISVKFFMLFQRFIFFCFYFTKKKKKRSNDCF